MKRTRKATTVSLTRKHELRGNASATQQWLWECTATNGGVIPLVLGTSEAGAVPLHDSEAERLWTPIVGTLAVAIARRLLFAIENGYQAVTVDELTLSLGVGHRGGLHSPLIRGLARAINFRLLSRDTHAVRVPYAVRKPYPADLARTATLWTAS